MSTRRAVVSLDIGSSSTRALAFDERGGRLKGVEAIIAHTVRTTADGGAELDPELLVENAVTCLAGVEGALREARVGVQAVSVCTFWHSLVGVDASGRALTPVYMWSDTRSARQVEQLRTTLDETACHQRTGCVFHTSYLPAKLLWLQTRHRDTFHRVRRWVSPGEYVQLRLFGTAVCSYSMASGTGLFNHRSLGWDTELLEAVNVDQDHLSPLVDVGEAVQGLRQAFRGRLGRLADVPWHPALGDGACSNVGSGGVTPSTATLMIGTSGALRVVPAMEIDPPWGIWKYRLDRNRCLLGGALSNGGNLQAWLADTLRVGAPATWEDTLRSLPPAAHGLTVLPFLAGERSPRWRPEATGAILGLRLNTRPEQIVQAMVEAVGHRFTLLAGELQRVVPPVTTYLATGGVLRRSPFWMQMLADMLNRPVVEATVTQASSRGAALLVLEASGRLPSLSAASPGRGRRFDPRPDRHQQYQDALARHRQAYEALARW